MSRGNGTKRAPTIRCAIYTRKSSDDGLDQEFNSLDAQRESAEAFIASQQLEGWTCIPDRYDDGGFTGGNMERPALRQLIADIDSGKVDCVVVYKVDRLSRSLLDFARMMETFERHNVSFVSVTQQFNTTHSMGRLTLNILLSFAQFEREIIGERIRDKIAAARRKGKWAGGRPLLGYDVDRSSGSPKLIVNPNEAARVRETFELYLELGSLLPVVQELNRRDWDNKVWITKKGQRLGGRAFNRQSLHQLLTNPTYIGKIKHKTDVYDGEHEALITEETFRRVQSQLQQNGRSGGAELKNRYGALLKQLMFCKACNRAMVHTMTGRGTKRYRYYTCCGAIKNGRDKCPTGSLPAAELENAVVDQISCIADDPHVAKETLEQARGQAQAAIEKLNAERRIIERGLARCHGEIRRTATAEPATSIGTARIADLHDQVRQHEQRLREIDDAIAQHKTEIIDEKELASAFSDFENVWGALSPREQCRILKLLIHRIEFDASDSSIEVSFYPSGIKALTQAGMEEAA